MPELTLVRHEHDHPACSIALPAEFQVGVTEGTLIVARAPEGMFSSSPFAPNLTLTVQPLAPDADLETLSVEALAFAQRAFNEWRLIDRTDVEVGGLPGERTLATYLVRPGSGVELGRDIVVTVEQWWVVGDGMMWVVSCSSESLDYAQVADLWTALAESLQPGSA